MVLLFAFWHHEYYKALVHAYSCQHGRLLCLETITQLYKKQGTIYKEDK